MKTTSQIKKWLEKPVRFDTIGHFLKPGARLLDVGCGNKAPYSTFDYYPDVSFSGIDWDDIPGKTDMTRFYRCDLEANDLSIIPDSSFDVINVSHIIEHVSSGEQLLENLAKKLAPGGVIYIETPSERSLKLPSWYGTLNFWDDFTHKKVYSIDEMENTLIRNGCTIKKSDIRRSIKRILLMPLYAILTLIRDRKINATVIWDVAGFAHYVLAMKK